MLKVLAGKRISLSIWLDRHLNLPERLSCHSQKYAYKYSEHNIDSLEPHHYTWPEIALGLIFFFSDSLRRLFCTIFGLTALCSYFYFFGGDILQYLRQGELTVTSTGSFLYGADYSKDFFIYRFEWKGVAIILGNLLLVPAFISVPGLMVFLSRWSDPDE